MEAVPHSSVKKRSNFKSAQDYEVQIPFIEDSYTFTKRTYSKLSEPAKNKISEKTYNDIVTKCSRILGCSLIEKKNNDTIIFPKPIKYLMALALCLFILYCGTMANSLRDIDGKEALLAIAAVSIITMILITTSLSIYNFTYPIKNFNNLSYFIVKNIGEYLEKVNKDLAETGYEFGLNDKGSADNRFLYVIKAQVKKNEK